MGTEDTVESILTVIGNPCKLSAVIIQKTGSKADPAACSDIGKGSFVVGAVEIADLP